MKKKKRKKEKKKKKGLSFLKETPSEKKKKAAELQREHKTEKRKRQRRSSSDDEELKSPVQESRTELKRRSPAREDSPRVRSKNSGPRDRFGGVEVRRASSDSKQRADRRDKDSTRGHTRRHHDDDDAARRQRPNDDDEARWRQRQRREDRHGHDDDRDRRKRHDGDDERDVTHKHRKRRERSRSWSTALSWNKENFAEPQSASNTLRVSSASTPDQWQGRGGSKSSSGEKKWQIRNCVSLRDFTSRCLRNPRYCWGFPFGSVRMRRASTPLKS